MKRMRQYIAWDQESSVSALNTINGRAGDWGEFVHHNRPFHWEDRDCPFCGCASYIAFCFEPIPMGENERLSHPDDAFECVDCGSVHTRGTIGDEPRKWPKRLPHKVRVGTRYYDV